MIFDSHCHLQFPQYDQDREEMIARAIAKKINMICVGTDFETSKRAIELANKHARVWATVGLHPNDNLGETFQAEVYEKLLKMPRVVAMGEIGLDYYRTTEEKDKEFQRQRFQEQLVVAKKVKMPVIIHSRDAGKGSLGMVHQDLLAILKNNLPPKLGVAHSFTGTVDEAREYLNLGFLLSFNGILTFARQYDDLVKFVPMDCVLIETDAPFLSPEPNRGQRNEPIHVIEVAKKIAELKKEGYDTVIQKSTENCQKLFGLIPGLTPPLKASII